LWDTKQELTKQQDVESRMHHASAAPGSPGGREFDMQLSKLLSGLHRLMEFHHKTFPTPGKDDMLSRIVELIRATFSDYDRPFFITLLFQQLAHEMGWHVIIHEHGQEPGLFYNSETDEVIDDDDDAAHHFHAHGLSFAQGTGGGTDDDVDEENTHAVIGASHHGSEEHASPDGDGHAAESRRPILHASSSTSHATSRDALRGAMLDYDRHFAVTKHDKHVAAKGSVKQRDHASAVQSDKERTSSSVRRALDNDLPLLGQYVFPESSEDEYSRRRRLQKTRTSNIQTHDDSRARHGDASTAHAAKSQSQIKASVSRKEHSEIKRDARDDVAGQHEKPAADAHVTPLKSSDRTPSARSSNFHRIIADKPTARDGTRAGVDEGRNFGGIAHRGPSDPASPASALSPPADTSAARTPAAKQGPPRPILTPRPAGEQQPQAATALPEPLKPAHAASKTDEEKTTAAPASSASVPLPGKGGGKEDKNENPKRRGNRETVWGWMGFGGTENADLHETLDLEPTHDFESSVYKATCLGVNLHIMMRVAVQRREERATLRSVKRDVRLIKDDMHDMRNDMTNQLDVVTARLEIITVQLDKQFRVMMKSFVIVMMLLGGMLYLLDTILWLDIKRAMLTAFVK
jgi:hypothetical protein